MKKVSLLVLLAALAALAGMVFIGCDDGNDKEDPPTSYTVTFKNGDKTLAVTADVDAALDTAWPTDDALEAVFGEIVSDTEFKVNEGWFDQDGKRFIKDTPVTKNLTVSPKWYEIPAADTLLVGTSNASEGTPLVVELTLSHVNDNPAARAGAYKFYRIGGTAVPENHILQIDAEYTITLKGGDESIEPHFIGFQASIDRYGWSLAWDQKSPLSQKIQKKVAGGKTAFVDNAIKLLVDQAESVAAIGDVLTVTFTKLDITDIGEPLTVTFKANGGTEADVVKDVYAGDAVSFLSTPKFTNASKVLKGWSTSASGTPQVDPTITTLTANTEYHAIWADAEFKVALGPGNNVADFATWADDDYLEYVITDITSVGNVGSFSTGDSWDGALGMFGPASAAEVPADGIVVLRFLVSSLKSHYSVTSTRCNFWSGTHTETNRVAWSDPSSEPKVFGPLGNNGEYGWQSMFTSGALEVGTQLTKDEVYAFTYTYTSDVDIDQVNLFFLDNSSANSYGWDMLTGYVGIGTTVTANTPISGSVDITITATASGTDSDANKFVLTAGATTASAPTLTFTTFTLVKK
jgi:hypothetical protein